MELSRRIEIGAPVDAVWRALVDGNELATWFAPAARVKPGVGGEVWLSWGEGMSGATPIDAWEPGRRLRTTSDRGAIEWTLEGREGGTELRLEQDGIGSEQELASLDQGWSVYLYNLKHLLERHRGEIGGQHYAFVPAPGSAAEIWQRLARKLAEEPLEVGKHVKLLSTGGEVVLCEPGQLLGIRLDDPADALLQLMFVSGAVMASLHLFGTDPDEARDLWTHAVLLVGED